MHSWLQLCWWYSPKDKCFGKRGFKEELHHCLVWIFGYFNTMLHARLFPPWKTSGYFPQGWVMKKTHMKPNLQAVCWLYCPIKMVLHFPNNIKHSTHCHVSQKRSSTFSVKIKSVMTAVFNKCVQYSRMMLMRKAESSFSVTH